MEPQLSYLRVKIKSLAEEAKIIRFEESRYPKWQPGLHSHRVHEVRDEQRSTLLAYAFLRGKPLTNVEKRDIPARIKNRAARIIEKYGGEPTRKLIDEQLVTYRDWLKSNNISVS